ncbi:MAG: methyltransferase [Alphaproteobacteria bacterium]|nr:methyltransferase [Alphaproteobacteria bacterium]
MLSYTQDYLLDKKVIIFQPTDGYRASTDAVVVSSLVHSVKKNDKILDVGSGTGAISLCLASRFQAQNPQIIGLELQAELASLSNMSAQANGFTDILHYTNCNIKDKLDFIKPCTFQHVISNPPYSDHDMPSPNISKAQAHNHTDFNLTEWIKFCIKMLVPQGKFYMINRAEAIDEILCALHSKLGNIKIIPLFTKPDTKAKRVLVTAQKDNKTPTEILPPFVVHSENAYTEKAFQILRKGKSFWD